MKERESCGFQIVCHQAYRITAYYFCVLKERERERIEDHRWWSKSKKFYFLLCLFASFGYFDVLKDVQGKFNVVSS